jgi:hypothetical protein
VKWFSPGEVVRPCANDLRPFYDDQAKARQGARNDLVNIKEKIPEGKDAPTARDEAGKVAGVNASASVTCERIKNKLFSHKDL